MRTVSFSHPKVADNLNQYFVSTFTNTLGDPHAGRSIEHSPDNPPGQCIRGNGKQNVQTIFMTPAGEIFHVSTGFLAADDLYEEMEFAYELFEDLNRESDPRKLVVESHLARLRKAGFTEEQIRSRMPFVMGMGVRGGLPGSTTRNLPVTRQSIFDKFIQRQILSDNQFSVFNPMMSFGELERDPTQLVGSGDSFFASSSSGGGRR